MAACKLKTGAIFRPTEMICEEKDRKRQQDKIFDNASLRQGQMSAHELLIRLRSPDIDIMYLFTPVSMAPDNDGVSTKQTEPGFTIIVSLDT